MSDAFTNNAARDTQIADNLPQPFLVASRDTGEDFTPTFVPIHRPKYKPGIHVLRCVAVRLRHMFGGHKLELEFEFPGTTDRVRAYLHMGRGPKPTVGAGSRYTQLWQEVTGRRSTRMPSKVFRWTYFECEIGDVAKTHDGKDQEAYSRVQNILQAVQR